MRGSKRKILKLLARIKRDGFQTPEELRAAAAAAARASRSEALRHYEDLRERGRRPSRREIAAALRACGSYRDLETGRRIHGEIGLANDPRNRVAGSLVAMYAMCGEIVEARRVFDAMGARKRPMTAWNAMAMGYVRAGMGDRALEVFHSMQRDGVRPDEKSFVAAIKACVAAMERSGGDPAGDKSGDLEEEERRREECLGRVRRIHGLLDTGGCWIVAAALRKAYTKCGSVVEADAMPTKVADAMPMTDLFLVNF